MLFPTVAFAVFFVVVFLFNWLTRPTVKRSSWDPLRRWIWHLGMIGASFYFYFRSPRGWPFLLLLAASVVGNWILGQLIWGAMDRRDGGAAKTGASRLIVGIGVAANLGVLGWFKYAAFFRDDVVELLDAVPGMPLDPVVWEVFLPVGISFYTFQALSYVIDVGRGRVRPMAFWDFALYLSFFPQLVAGPIVRATEFAPQLRQRPDPRSINSAEAFRLILAGLFKKVVISSLLASEIVDEVFAVPTDFSGWENLWAVYGFAIQIYADFSGYTDIAIGCALLLGFRFPQNFDAPYRSLSIQEFWRRWHMTLSRWLRDYLYIPLGGNRRGDRRTYVNLFLTMLLGGLWHGAAWTFVIWGAIHGGVLALERVIRSRWQPIGLPDPVVRVLQWVLTFHIVCLAWIFFRADSLEIATEVLGQILGLASGVGPSLVTGLIVGVITVMVALQFVPERAVVRVQDQFSRLGLAWQGAALAVGLTVVDILGPEGVAPFIYFQF